MGRHTNPLAFPNERPSDYILLDKEPLFRAKDHLRLEKPESIYSLQSLGYSNQEVAACESSFGYSSAFRILSDEGIQIMKQICDRINSNRNASSGTGSNRLGSYVRGAGYRSNFIRDFCDSPELREHVSAISEISLGRHSVPAVACGINYAPDDITKAIDTWHVDSVSFDIVMMVSNPTSMKGGEFQIFNGTKEEGQAILGIKGEEGANTALPHEKVITIPIPAAGYGFLQQGSMIFHRACRLLEHAERITMIPSFEILPRYAKDDTNSINMSSWADPGICAELARHEISRASARLDALLDQISLNDKPVALASKIHRSVDKLLAFSKKLESMGNKND